MAKNKKFRLVDAILSVITVVFVAEAAAPAAAIGNSQFFWWIFLIIAFLLPYGLVVSELGTTYDDEGGLYDWVRRAFGDKWGSRVSWYYWINFPLWMASLAFLFPETISMITGMEIGLVPSLAIASCLAKYLSKRPAACTLRLPEYHPDDHDDRGQHRDHFQA